MKLLALDIETSPILAYTFRTAKAYIGPEQIVEDPRILCFSYQWIGEKAVKFSSEYYDSREEMLQLLHDLLDEADALIHYNGRSFDVPWITGELIDAGYNPPSPFKQIDLYQTMRTNTRWPSKKLKYVSKRILDDTKVNHTGFQLWVDCLLDDGVDDKRKAAAWKLMRKYCIQDTRLLEPLYKQLLPWIKNHPNVALFEGKEVSCPRCGSGNVNKRGTEVTGASTFQRFQCQDCGGWSRLARRSQTTDLRSI